MEKVQEAVFFLGANTPKGFYGLFSELQEPHMRQLYILKGGPGNGKSTYLRKIARAAQDAGYFVEHIPCASDPGSLDGVYIPEKGLAWVDGTSPHVMEPSMPAIRESYVNLGVLWDRAGIVENADALAKLFPKYKRLQAGAARFVRAAGQIYETILDMPEEFPTEKLLRRARNIIARELPKRASATRGRENLRFLSAVTPEGLVCKYETARFICPKVYEFIDSFGFASVILEKIRDAALLTGLDVYTCLNPLSPEKIAHIMIPGLGIVFVSSDAVYACPYAPFRRINLDRIVCTDNRTLTAALRENRKLIRVLLDRAVRALSEAKSLHDEIETYYNPHVDFDTLRRMADEMIRQEVL